MRRGEAFTIIIQFLLTFIFNFIKSNYRYRIFDKEIGIQ